METRKSTSPEAACEEEQGHLRKKSSHKTRQRDNATCVKPSCSLTQLQGLRSTNFSILLSEQLYNFNNQRSSDTARYEYRSITQYP